MGVAAHLHALLISRILLHLNVFALRLDALARLAHLHAEALHRALQLGELGRVLGNLGLLPCKSLRALLDLLMEGGEALVARALLLEGLELLRLARDLGRRRLLGLRERRLHVTRLARFDAHLALHSCKLRT